MVDILRWPVPSCACCKNNQRPLSSRTGKALRGREKTTLRVIVPRAWHLSDPCLSFHKGRVQNYPAAPTETKTFLNTPGTLQLNFRRCCMTSRAQQEMSQGNNDEKKKNISSHLPKCLHSGNLTFELTLTSGAEQTSVLILRIKKLIQRCEGHGGGPVKVRARSWLSAHLLLEHGEISSSPFHT